MLPALTPRYTVSPGTDRRTSARPDCRIQYDRNTGSPPQTSRASVSRTAGTQHSSSMLGSTESSSTPKDFQPNPAKGLLLLPQIASHAWPAPPGKGYIAVGMTRALDSSIGLPSRPRSASWMLVFAMPEDVSRRFMAFPLYRAVTSGNPPACRSWTPGRRAWSCGHGRPCHGTPSSPSAWSLRQSLSACPSRRPPRPASLRTATSGRSVSAARPPGRSHGTSTLSRPASRRPCGSPPDAQVDRADRHLVLERGEPVADVLRLRQPVEDELDRRAELPGGDDLELARVFDDCGPVAFRCH